MLSRRFSKMNYYLDLAGFLNLKLPFKLSFFLSSLSLFLPKIKWRIDQLVYDHWLFLSPFWFQMIDKIATDYWCEIMQELTYLNRMFSFCSLMFHNQFLYTSHENVIELWCSCLYLGGGGKEVECSRSLEINIVGSLEPFLCHI